MSKSSQPTLVEVKRLAFAEQQQQILNRLQITALPDHHTQTLPLERLQVPDEHAVHVPTSFVHSIERFGVLQAPCVVRCSPTEEVEEQARYEVITGRRRTKGAKLAGLTELTCEVYTSSTPQLSALLALIENAQRSSAWVKEVADLRMLIDQQVGLTVPELLACGFTQVGLEQRLKIAQLPAPLLDQIVAGKVPLEVARTLVRLTESQRARVMAQAQDGPLTAELVKQALKAQLNAALSPMQVVFPRWEPPSAASRTIRSQALDRNETTTTNDGPYEASASQPLAELLTALQTFTQSTAYHRMADVQTLIQALMQRLDLAMREISIDNTQESETDDA